MKYCVIQTSKDTVKRLYEVRADSEEQAVALVETGDLEHYDLEIMAYGESAYEVEQLDHPTEEEAYALAEKWIARLDASEVFQEAIATRAEDYMRNPAWYEEALKLLSVESENESR
jgi:hypothetical protein